MTLATLPGAVAPTTVVAIEISVRSTCRSRFLSTILNLISAHPHRCHGKPVAPVAMLVMLIHIEVKQSFW